MIAGKGRVTKVVEYIDKHFKKGYTYASARERIRNSFQELQDEIHDRRLDVCEEGLDEIAEGADLDKDRLTAIKYILDHLGRDRGYGKPDDNVPTDLNVRITYGLKDWDDYEKKHKRQKKD